MIKNLSFILIGVTLLFTSCARPVNEEKIVGNWKVIDMQLEEVEESSINPVLIDEEKVEALSSWYELLDDGQSSLTSAYYQQGVSGNWKFSEEHQEIEIAHADEMSPSKYKVLSCSRSTMVWIQDIPNLGKLTLTLSRKQPRD